MNETWVAHLPDWNRGETVWSYIPTPGYAIWLAEPGPPRRAFKVI